MCWLVVMVLVMIMFVSCSLIDLIEFADCWSVLSALIGTVCCFYFRIVSCVIDQTVMISAFLCSDCTCSLCVLLFELIGTVHFAMKKFVFNWVASFWIWTSISFHIDPMWLFLFEFFFPVWITLLKVWLWLFYHRKPMSFS